MDGSGGGLRPPRTPLPRVAFLPDTFHEVNGVAHTSRHFEAFARRRQIPFLSVHAGGKTEFSTDGSVQMHELSRGPAQFALDSNLAYDPFLLRHASRVQTAMERFKPDLIHVTGPGDMGTLGCYLGLLLKIPLVMSWHTSLHEYAGRRIERLTEFLGDGTSHAIGSVAEEMSLQVLRAFYSQAVMIMAPNQELIELTHKLTRKPVYLMKRGVDATLFNPAKRNRTDGRFRIGYVGRLTPEKNVRFLAEVAHCLLALGLDFELLIVGEGNESDWLRQHIPNATFTGVLRGEELASAYAGMDLFAFPSSTDTYGNVVLEALASGVPCVVTKGGGPKFLITQDTTGHVARDTADFIAFTAMLARSPDLQQRMSLAARAFALDQSWDSVFESVYYAYGTCVPAACAA